ncbi:MAG: TraB/GumN family protein [Candidatus Woesearchaeota archaeon]
MPRIVIVGTSHVASESLRRVDAAMEAYKPDVVGIELDRRRLHSLEKGLPSASFWQLWRRAGLFSATFFTVGRMLQQKIGTSLGLQPGSEMLHALRAARENGASVALVDRDITATLAALRRIPRREKLRFIIDLIPGRSKPDDALANLDLDKIPPDEVVETVLEHMRSRYPSFYRVLVEDRNRTIARNALRLSEHFDTVLLVIGKAHSPGVEELVRSKDAVAIIA